MPHAGFRLRTDTPRSDNSRVRASDSHPKTDTPCCPGFSHPNIPEHAWSGNGQPPGLCPGDHGPRSARWCNVPSTRSGTIYRNRMSFPESLRSCTPGVSLSLDPIRRVHPDAYDIRHVLRKNACPYRKDPFSLFLSACTMNPGILLPPELIIQLGSLSPIQQIGRAHV